MRTTHDEVRAIMDVLSATTTDTIIDSYIASANAMVNQVMGTTETTAILTEIEKWLAAHMVAITRERQALKEAAGTAKVEYNGKFGEGLKTTTYGQMVLSLDTTNAFADLGYRKASIYAVVSFTDTE